jgi:hypothetical protein
MYRRKLAFRLSLGEVIKMVQNREGQVVLTSLAVCSSPS